MNFPIREQHVRDRRDLNFEDSLRVASAIDDSDAMIAKPMEALVHRPLQMFWFDHMRRFSLNHSIAATLRPLDLAISQFQPTKGSP